MDTATYGNYAKIKVIGIGTSGSNAVDRMIEDCVDNVEFISVDTDKRVLDNCKSPIKILIGEKLTRGFGAGGISEIGMGAVEESREEISQVIDGADMIIIVAGMGGGTGTGSSPAVAKIAKSKGILTLGIVTKPYLFEGDRKMKRALDGINRLNDNIDTLIVISNQNLLEDMDKKRSTIIDYFRKSDEILNQVVQNATKTITELSLAGLDFFDIKEIMRNDSFMSKIDFACIDIGLEKNVENFTHLEEIPDVENISIPFTPSWTLGERKKNKDL